MNIVAQPLNSLTNYRVASPKPAEHCLVVDDVADKDTFLATCTMAAQQHNPPLPYDKIGLNIERKHLDEAVKLLKMNTKVGAKKAAGNLLAKSLSYFAFVRQSPFGLCYAGNPKKPRLHPIFVIPADEDGAGVLAELIAKHFAPSGKPASKIKPKALQQFLSLFVKISAKPFVTEVWKKPEYQYCKDQVDHEMTRLNGMRKKAANAADIMPDNQQGNHAAGQAIVAQESVAGVNAVDQEKIPLRASRD